VSKARYWQAQLLGAALLIVAAISLPWATYTDTTTRTTMNFRGGGLSLLLVAVALASIVLALFSITRAWSLLSWAHLTIGCAALVVSIALALTKISAANHVTQEGPSRTSYALGPVVAVVAAAAIALTGLVRLVTPKEIETSPASQPHIP
jgi:hypothetical protein